MNKISHTNDILTLELGVRDTFYTRNGKRAFDLAFAILLLPILGPIIFLIVLLVCMDGHRPVFGHVRVGKNGKLFKCWKIRTMKPNAEELLLELLASNSSRRLEWEKFQKLEKDPRITLVGKALRRLRLDELPQIFNVVKGDMSFVGPRPFTPEQKNIYDGTGSKHYYRVRPGITGPWQVKNVAISEFIDRVDFDDHYAQTLSFMGDTKIILHTFVVFMKLNGQ